MAKYFSFYLIPSYEALFNVNVYYNEINPNNFGKYAYTNVTTKNLVSGPPGEQPVQITDVEVPDSATSIIIQTPYGTVTYPLVSTPPVVGTLFLTFDTID